MVYKTLVSKETGKFMVIRGNELFPSDVPELHPYNTNKTRTIFFLMAMRHYDLSRRIGEECDLVDCEVTITQQKNTQEMENKNVEETLQQIRQRVVNLQEIIAKKNKIVDNLNLEKSALLASISKDQQELRLAKQKLREKDPIQKRNEQNESE